MFVRSSYVVEAIFLYAATMVETVCAQQTLNVTIIQCTRRINDVRYGTDEGIKWWKVTLRTLWS